MPRSSRTGTTPRAAAHDTRYCFLGQRRFDALERTLPADAFVLGIDEHTALVIDLGAGLASVHGRGNVTVRRVGQETVYPNGSQLPLERLSSVQTLEARPVGDDQRPADENLAARLVELEDRAALLVNRASLVEPLVRELLLLRAQARAMAVYEVADQVRDLLTSLGIEVTDAPDGTSDFRLPDQ